MRKLTLGAVAVSITVVGAVCWYTGWPIPRPYVISSEDGHILESSAKRWVWNGWSNEGHGRVYAKDGERRYVLEEGNYRHNKHVGEWKIYRSDGTVKWIEDYGPDGGARKRTIFLDEQGNTISVQEHNDQPTGFGPVLPLDWHPSDD